MRYSRLTRRSVSPLRALILLGLLSSSACTTQQPRAATPRLPDPLAPAECRKDAFQAFADELTGLPPNWRALSKDERARVDLENKAIDATNYRTLRAQAIRCAPAR